MFSGKTSELIKNIERRIIIGDKCVVIGWKDDKRYSDKNEIVCHNKLSYPCLKMDEKELSDSLPEIINTYDTIGIDEGCFFSNIYSVCVTLKNANKHIYCSSLVGTHSLKPFGDILSIIPICTDIKFLHAICTLCKSENACFSHLTQRNLKNIKIGDKNLIGGQEKYEALCEPCFKTAD